MNDIRYNIGYDLVFKYPNLVDFVVLERTFCYIPKKEISDMNQIYLKKQCQTHTSTFRFNFSFNFRLIIISYIYNLY